MLHALIQKLVPHVSLDMAFKKINAILVLMGLMLLQDFAIVIMTLFNELIVKSSLSCDMHYLYRCFNLYRLSGWICDDWHDV